MRQKGGQDVSEDFVSACACATSLAFSTREQLAIALLDVARAPIRRKPGSATAVDGSGRTQLVRRSGCARFDAKMKVAEQARRFDRARWPACERASRLAQACAAAPAPPPNQLRMRLPSRCT
jgi:hypothetical protein